MSPQITCASCGTASDGAFCRQCGARLATSTRHPGDRRAWRVAGIVSVVAVAGVVFGVARSDPPGAPPAMANAGSAPVNVVPLPDLSSMGPEERFAQLFDRLMRAGAEWDSATVASLSPLAVAAYADLDSVDADTRFHAGLIAIQIGNFQGAHALADTLEAKDPGHLFGPILKGALARLEGDTLKYQEALDQFRRRAEKELARADRPEYVEHRQLLNDVQQAAETP